jgi:hypothetical protein
MSPDEIIFGYGVPLLTSAGSTDKHARSFLGGLRKAHGDDAVVSTLRECIRAKPLQPMEWLAAAMLPDASGPAETRHQKAKREQMMRDFPDYQAQLSETHHTQKLDAPSGTAITLAEGVIQEIPRIRNWTLSGELNENEHNLPITSKRIDPAPGTHIVRYQSDIDDIEITHTAHSRKGFALGAVLVAEWIKNKKGVLSMDEFLSF